MRTYRREDLFCDRALLFPRACFRLRRTACAHHDSLLQMSFCSSTTDSRNIMLRSDNMLFTCCRIEGRDVQSHQFADYLTTVLFAVLPSLDAYAFNVALQSATEVQSTTRRDSSSPDRRGRCRRPSLCRSPTKLPPGPKGNGSSPSHCGTG